MIQRVGELQTEPVVGKFYMVPCVRLGGEWIPVIGPRHEDADYIGGAAAHAHFHWDVRFLSERTIEEDFHDGKVYGAKGAPVEQATLTIKFAGNAPVTGRRMKCRRGMPDFPLRPYGRRAPWVGKMERAYRDASAKCGRCPHRGMPLNGLPVKDGKVICPGHGLAWDVKTGKLVPRTEGR